MQRLWTRTVLASPATALASGARHPLLAVAAGSVDLVASPDDLVTAKAQRTAPARRLERSFSSASRVSPRAAATRSKPEVAYARPAQTWLPIAGATAGASGGPGSAAPPVAAIFAALGLSLATILLARFSLDLSPWRSALLAPPLEHPG